MSRERALVVLVVADIFLSFATIGAEMFFQWTLPWSLRDYDHSRWSSPFSAFGAFKYLLWAGTIAATLVAWVGLLNRWWFARRLYLAAWGTWTALILLSGPSVLNFLGATFDTLQAMVGGAILSLIYFSDLSRHFEKSPAAVTNGAAARA